MTPKELFVCLWYGIRFEVYNKLLMKATMKMKQEGTSKNVPDIDDVKVRDIIANKILKCIHNVFLSHELVRLYYIRVVSDFVRLTSPSGRIDAEGIGQNLVWSSNKTVNLCMTLEHKLNKQYFPRAKINLEGLYKQDYLRAISEHALITNTVFDEKETPHVIIKKVTEDNLKFFESVGMYTFGNCIRFPLAGLKSATEFYKCKINEYPVEEHNQFITYIRAFNMGLLPDVQTIDQCELINKYAPSEMWLKNQSNYLIENDKQNIIREYTYDGDKVINAVLRGDLNRAISILNDKDTMHIPFQTAIIFYLLRLDPSEYVTDAFKSTFANGYNYIKDAIRTKELNIRIKPEALRKALMKIYAKFMKLFESKAYSPLEKDIIVYRGVTDIKHLIADPKTNEITIDGFLSTSQDPNVAAFFANDMNLEYDKFGNTNGGICRIVVPAGTRCLIVNNPIYDEKEIILPHGIRLKQVLPFVKMPYISAKSEFNGNSSAVKFILHYIHTNLTMLIPKK